MTAYPVVKRKVLTEFMIFLCALSLMKDATDEICINVYEILQWDFRSV